MLFDREARGGLVDVRSDLFSLVSCPKVLFFLIELLPVSTVERDGVGGSIGFDFQLSNL